MKALIYEIRDCLLRSFDIAKKARKEVGEDYFNIYSRFNKDYKRLLNPLISPGEIAFIGRHLVGAAFDDNKKYGLAEGMKEIIEDENKEVVKDSIVICFYDFLNYIYNENISDIPVKKNYYHFVENFAENLSKLKVPNFDKLKISDVFHEDDHPDQYIEINVNDNIISFSIHRNAENKIVQINFFIYHINRFRTKNLSLPENVVEYPTSRFFLSYLREENGKACEIGDDLFFKIFDANNDKFKESLHFLTNCLLYIQSGDPDIRHMKGENPRKYKINPKDSFFEKRQKQVLSQDAVFNDYELVGWNYKKQYNVAGHWRYQAYGPKWSQHKLIFIESFKKGEKK